MPNEQATSSAALSRPAWPGRDFTANPFTEHERALLAEHEGDTCEHGGYGSTRCVPECPRQYCISDDHEGDSPDWPCEVAAPILGFTDATAYWAASDADEDWYWSQQEAMADAQSY